MLIRVAEKWKLRTKGRGVLGLGSTMDGVPEISWDALRSPLERLAFPPL